MKSSLFYRYYDILYASKDYAGEVKDLMAIAGKYHPSPVKNILEVGCGTGNHTVEFAKTGKNITALDTDRFMADIAKRKTKALGNVSVKLGRVEKLNRKGFDIGFAMFNVITYIPEMNSLISFFKGVSSSLKNRGVFIFDCWNGIAAMKDPPASKTFSREAGNKKITCGLKSVTDFMDQKVKLQYSLRVSGRDEKTLEEGLFSFDQTLWTPMEIRYALESAGFRVLECCRNFQPGTAASESDWKIMFICKNTGK